MKTKNKGVFFDRDGTLNPDPGYINDPARFAFFPGVVGVLRRLSAAGFKLFVVSNQSGVSRGKITRKQLGGIDRKMRRLLASKGVLLDGAAYCLHHPDEKCSCRKPGTKLVADLAERHAVDLSRSWFVGDKAADIECGRNAGCKTILVRAGRKAARSGVFADFVEENVLASAERILEQERTGYRSDSDVVEGFQGKKVLVVGDVMLDEYFLGTVTRMSPEALVPVVDVEEHLRALGGAANVAANVVSLGGVALLSSVVGADQAAAAFRRCLSSVGIDDSLILSEKARCTTVKSRVITGKRHLVRFDREDRRPALPETEDAIISAIARKGPGCDAIVVSDYAKGVVTGKVVRFVSDFALKTGIPLFVDSKNFLGLGFRRATVLKPNLKELEKETGIKASSFEGIRRGAMVFLEKLGPKAVMVTCGKKGIFVFTKTSSCLVPAVPTPAAVDVSGAGDTTLAAMVLSLAGGASFEQAARISNAAASVAISKVGTAAVQADELKAVLEKQG